MLTANKLVRPFTCHDCGHQMRFRGRRCGRCHAEKSFYQRPSVIISFLIVSALAVSATLAFV